MLRPGALLVTLSALLLLGVGAADARTSPRCSARGATTLLRTPAVLVYAKVNTRDSYRGRTVYACVRHTGRRRTIGSIASLTTESADTTVRAHSGVQLVVDTSLQNQYGSSSRTRWWNVATGRTRTLYALDAPLGSPARSTGVPLTQALLTSDGCTLLALSVDQAADTATVLTAPRSGALAELDRGAADAIPSASLRLSGHTATWTNAGQSRKADLSRASC
jgi:hypothetical protein